MITSNYNNFSVNFGARISRSTLKRVRSSYLSPEIDKVVENKISQVRKWGNNDSKYSLLSIRKSSTTDKEAFYISDGKNLQKSWRVSSEFAPDDLFLNFMSLNEYEIKSAQRNLATIEKFNYQA